MIHVVEVNRLVLVRTGSTGTSPGIVIAKPVQ